jgi:hypothetical protein
MFTLDLDANWNIVGFWPIAIGGMKAVSDTTLSCQVNKREYIFLLKIFYCANYRR